ncbi:MAG: sigma 54-interacting transcriptional regulator [Chitinophagaceae bacterium]
MKKTATIKDDKAGKGYPFRMSQTDIKTLQEQITAYEKEKNILLALSNDITKAREKDDLVDIFSSKLRSYFYFTHAVISLIDKPTNTYYPFLLNRETLPIRHRSELPSMLTRRYSINDPFISQLADSDNPVSFLLNQIIDIPGVPGFIKLYIESGIKKVLMARLKSKMETIGYVFIYSDETDSFPDDFTGVLHGIAPHLSNAVTNIIINEEIKRKELINQILLSLSNDMVTVRDRADLMKVINFGLKKLIYFTHSVMTVLNESGETYQAFLTDPHSRAKRFPEYAEMVTQPVTVNDGIYNVASSSYKPLVFDMKTFNPEKVPLWFKLNYEAGAKEMLIKILPGEDIRRHSIILFSDKENTFDGNCLEIIERIASQFATAANNISANEEIANKERDKSSLLEFSHNIAAVRTKSELSSVINNSLKKLTHVRAFFIRIINEDGVTMSPLMHDDEIFYRNEPAFKKLLLTKIPVNEGITGRVMQGTTPVLIDFEEEVRKGHSDYYIEFWKTLGDRKKEFQKIIGTPICAGDEKLGVLWVVTDKINMTILDGICAQLSIAIANVKANEEIASRESEKSILLSLSDEIAALRSRADLLHVVNKKLKTLFGIDDFGLLSIDEDSSTYSTFALDLGDYIKRQDNYEQITSAKYKTTDRVFTTLADSEDPVLFNVHALGKETDIPSYVDFWKKIGLHYVMGAALRVGGKVIGCAFLHIDPNEDLKKKTSLLKAVFAQLSVAVSNILANEQVLSYKQMLEIENDHLKEQISTIYNFSEIIGSGPEMQKVYHMMSQVAESNSTVLLLGETGTGKELIARAIHNASPRKNKLMVKVNCAALPASLIESELFGHERGAFTGAIERRIGKFELANNSTLFLDEIGEMPLETQVKLLRVIQERELERVGGSNTIKVDVRIIVATNRNLEEEVSAGRFRSDLFYRLNVFPIHLPPLRNRMEDIAPLANFFLARYCKNTGKKVMAISSNVIKELKGYQWPGNVRELEHLIERSILLTNEKVLKEVQLPVSSKEIKGSTTIFSSRSLHDIERSYIIEVLKKCKGKIAGTDGASHLLEIPSTTLHSKIKKLGITKADYYTRGE